MVTEKASKKNLDNARATKETLDLLHDIEGVVKINAVAMTHEDRHSTGLLGLDLMMGSGVAPGMYVFVGPEQSAKTTAAITIMGASGADTDIKVKALFDAEGSTGNSADYVSNIFETQGFKIPAEEVFGVRDATGKGWRIPPTVYYQDISEGETIFNWIYALAKRLPDKRFSKNRWWYVYENSTENKKKWADVADKTQGQGQEGLWVPAKNGALQAMILLDSLPAILADALDDDEASNALAVDARMFSKHLKRIKGSFRRKRIALIAINQLRTNPGARFSDPRYEPGGNAVAFFSDVRFWLTPRALSGVPFNPKGDKGEEVEPSVNGGEDRYRYIHCGLKKNKLSSHVKETWMRLWVADSNGEGRGYDPVWDTFYYLYSTGQLEGKKSSIKLNVAKVGEALKAITWLEFKTLILGNKDQWEPIYKKIGYKTINLRAGCFNQMKKGKGTDLYFAKIGAGKTKLVIDSNDDDVDAE